LRESGNRNDQRASRKARVSSPWSRAHPEITVNAHYDSDDDTVKDGGKNAGDGSGLEQLDNVPLHHDGVDDQGDRRRDQRAGMSAVLKQQETRAAMPRSRVSARETRVKNERGIPAMRFRSCRRLS
jgi:hypothetical protein